MNKKGLKSGKVKLLLLMALVISTALILSGCDGEPEPEPTPTPSPTRYTVAIADGIENGTISADPNANVAQGATVTLTVIPNSNYRLKPGSLIAQPAAGAAITPTGTGTSFTFTMPASNVTVSGEFESTEGLPTKNVVISSLQNGAIIANPSSAAEGVPVELTITPNPGYQLKAGSLSVVHTGTTTTVPVANNSFTMPDAEVTVTAVFDPIPYIVTVSIVGGTANGNITAVPNTAVTIETTVTLTINPAGDYQLKAGSLSVVHTGTTTTVNINSTGTNTITFTMPASNVTVSGEFEQITYVPSFNIEIDNGITNGIITANPSANITEGTPVTLTATPIDSSFRLRANSLTVTRNDTLAEVPLNDNTFNMPGSDIFVTAEFEPIPYAINIPSLQGGSITALDEGTPITEAVTGRTITLSIQTAPNHVLTTLSVTGQGGEPVQVNFVDETTRTFVMPPSDVNISGTFEEISADAKPVTIIFEGFGDETIDLTGDVEGNIQREQWLNISIDSYYDEISWYVHGNILGSGNHFGHVVYSPPGIYTITAVVGIYNYNTGSYTYYSKVLRYRVVE